MPSKFHTSRSVAFYMYTQAYLVSLRRWIESFGDGSTLNQFLLHCRLHFVIYIVRSKINVCQKAGIQAPTQYFRIVSNMDLSHWIGSFVYILYNSNYEFVDGSYFTNDFNIFFLFFYFFSSHSFLNHLISSFLFSMFTFLFYFFLDLFHSFSS